MRRRAWPSGTWPWLVAAAVLVVARTLVFVVYPALTFDADQAVVGLMAKHIAEARAWPVHQYALTYVVEVTAYLAAPFMWLFGPTMTALRLPLLVMNVGVGVALVALIARTGVRPPVALAAALPLVVASPGTSAALTDALGMTVEPLAFVLALWWLRDRPVAFGVVAALGFRVREFAAYGVAAILLVDAVDGRLFSRAALRHWLLVAVGAAGMFGLLAGLARFETPRGPGTWVDEAGNGLETLSGAFCFDPSWAARNVVDLGVRYLGLLYGAKVMPVEDAIVRSDSHQGAPGLWLLVGVALLLMGARAVAALPRLWADRRHGRVQLGLFLTAVGAQAVLVYAISRCGPLSALTLRYALLGLFLPSGIMLLFLHVETRPRLRAAALGVFVLLAAVSLRDHVRLACEEATSPQVANRLLLADALERAGIRYAYADYWTAYYVSFVTQERVLVVPDVLSRIAFHEREVEAHAAEAVRISVTPCDDAPPIAPGYHVCRVSR